MSLPVLRGTAALAELIDPAVDLALVADGFAFTEGPAWSPAGQDLVFSDIPGDTRYRWSEADGLSVDLRPTFKGNGMFYERDGSLLVCEQASSLLVRYPASDGPGSSLGERQVLASHYQGLELNSPNDVITRSDGTIYFTDPNFGREDDVTGVFRPPSPLGFMGVFRLLTGSDEPELLVERDEFNGPNGLCFSPDESVLYVDDLTSIKAFDVAPDGTLGPARLLRDDMGRQRGEAYKGVPDGMRCDERGDIWCTAAGGVWVVLPSGDLLGIIETPEVCANLAWGGPDLRTLFLCTSTSLRAVPTLVGPAVRRDGF
jgi:gluconolactonase